MLSNAPNQNPGLPPQEAPPAKAGRIAQHQRSHPRLGGVSYGGNGLEARQAPRRAARIFNGCYTIQNQKTGEHRTFRIRTQPNDARFAPGKRVVALLSGPDNTSDYQPFGFVNDDGIHVWRKYKAVLGPLHTAYQSYAGMLWDLAAVGPKSRTAKAGYQLLAEGACLRCNKLLTNPVSLSTGIGPKCGGRQ